MIHVKKLYVLNLLEIWKEALQDQYLVIIHEDVQPNKTKKK